MWYNKLAMMRSKFTVNFMKVRNTMTKTRLLSMLLAIALVFTSLPLMATAVSAEEAPAAMEKGDKIAIPNKAEGWTGIAAYDESYVSTWIRSQGYPSVVIPLYNPSASDNALAEDTQYTIKMALRSADAEFAAVKPTGNATSITPGSVYFMVHYQGSGSTYLGQKVVDVSALTATPTDYSFNFTIPTGTDKTWGIRLVETRSSNNTTYSPVGVAGIVVYETANANNIVYSWGTYSADSANKNWDVINSTFGQTYYGNTYLGADVTAATSATYDVADTKLLPGVYQLTGTFNTDADSIALSAKVNDTLMNVGSTTATEVAVDTNATTIYYTINVEEETTLETLGLAWTVNGSATRLMLSDLSFKCVELTGASTNASIKRGSVVASAASVAFWSTEDAEASIVMDNSKNYVAMTVRGIYSMERVRVYTPNDPASPCEAGKMYTYTILMRENPDTEDHASSITVNVSDNGNSSPGANPIHSNTFNTIPTDFTELTGSFTVPSDCANSKDFKIFADFSGSYNGNGADKRYTDWDFRGIKITDADGNDVIAYGCYNEKLAPSEWVMPKTSYDTQKPVGETELALITDADGSTFAYDATGKDITLAPGTYVVTGNFAAASGSQTVQLGVTAADGTTALGEEFTVGATKSPVTVEIEIESTTKLSGISVIVDGKVYVGDITIAEKAPKFSAPNVGILMALLLKKGPRFEYSNLLDKAVSDVGTSYWTVPGNCTLTVTQPDEGASYISMKGMEHNLDKFVYTPDITLQPGDYKFTFSIRSASKGVKTMVRAVAGGNTYGNVWIDNAWLTLGGTFTVNEATDFSVAFFGGPDQSFKQPYDISGLKLIYLNEDPDYVPSEEPVEEEKPKPEVEVEYVDEGNEEVVLKAVEGSLAPDVFTDVGSDKWEIGDQSLTVKSQGGNLYLAMRDITVNHMGFAYKSGVTLQPGTYYFSADVRAAIKGDKTMLRAIINNETIVGNVWYTDEWATVSGQFTVTVPTEFTVKFFGGPDQSFIQDYDVSNILVTNIG